MSAYTKAANFVLDALWENETFRAHFHDLGAELADLGPLTQIVFEPAYLRFKTEQDPDAMYMLESQIEEDLLAPLRKQPNFQRMWDEWDQATREAFVKEQSELQLARLLIQVYDNGLAAAYQRAYSDYLATQDNAP